MVFPVLTHLNSSYPPKDKTKDYFFHTSCEKKLRILNKIVAKQPFAGQYRLKSMAAKGRAWILLTIC